MAEGDHVILEAWNTVLFDKFDGEEGVRPKDQVVEALRETLSV